MVSNNDSIVSRFGRWLADVGRGPEFTCGDCERSLHCGRPPDEACIIKAQHLERGDWKARRHYRMLARTIGPI